MVVQQDGGDSAGGSAGQQQQPRQGGHCKHSRALDVEMWQQLSRAMVCELLPLYHWVQWTCPLMYNAYVVFSDLCTMVYTLAFLHLVGLGPMALMLWLDLLIR
jgi:hypothetical protein